MSPALSIVDIHGDGAWAIVILVISLALASLVWNLLVLYYCRHERIVNMEITESRPLKGWVLRALMTLVAAQTIGLVLLSVVQVTRNYYLSLAVGTEVAPVWLFWVVAAQNTIFYGLSVLPAVILFAYVWALKTLLADREGRLSEEKRDSLGMEDTKTSHTRRSKRLRQQN